MSRLMFHSLFCPTEPKLNATPIPFNPNQPAVFDPKRHAVYTAGPPPRPGQPRHSKHVLEYAFVHRDHRELEQFALQPLLCADPIRPDNNIGKTCYRVHQIQVLLGDGARRLCKAAIEASIQESSEKNSGVSDGSERDLAKGSEAADADFLEKVLNASPS